MNQTTQRRPHEARVIAEKAEIETRVFALTQFMSSTTWDQVDAAEQARLKRQLNIMLDYSLVLDERVKAFPPMPAAPAASTPAEGEAAAVDRNAYKEAVIPGAAPIGDIDEFAMIVDQWHAQKIEQGNRMLEIPEGTMIEVEDQAKPGEVIAMELSGAYHQVFNVGVLAVLNIFKDLPFGASIEVDDTDADPEDRTIAGDLEEGTEGKEAADDQQKGD